MDMLTLVVGIVIADLGIAAVLWRGCSAARGWCRDCDAPDLWTAYAFTRTAKVYGVLSCILTFVGMAFAVTAEQLGTPPQFLLASSAILILVALMFAVKSRNHRRRLLRCRTCETQYDPTIKQGRGQYLRRHSPG